MCPKSRETGAAPLSLQLPYPLIPDSSRGQTELSGERCERGEIESVVFLSAAAAITNFTC